MLNKKTHLCLYLPSSLYLSTGVFDLLLGDLFDGGLREDRLRGELRSARSLS